MAEVFASAPDGDDDRPTGAVWLESYRYGLVAELTPAEARALAIRLQETADYAEGKA